MTNLIPRKIWTKGLVLAFLVLVPFLFLVSSQSAKTAPEAWEDWEAGCTSIMVGKLASTDGSVMTAHSCDGNYRTWVKMEPHLEHNEGVKAQIFHGLLHNEFSGDMRRVTVAGEIPQAPETYAFLNTAYPCLNEKQLAIGETTIGGRRELRNTEGLFLIEELERMALERCDNARDAIKLIGQLVKEYGYCDSGECITIADPKEVWHFEIMGAGPLEIGAVWAASRTTMWAFRPTSPGSESWISTIPTTSWPRRMCSESPKRWAGGTPQAGRLSSSGKLTAAASPFRRANILS
jgi:dipeptidase